MVIRFIYTVFMQIINHQSNLYVAVIQAIRTKMESGKELGVRSINPVKIYDYCNLRRKSDNS